MAPYWEPGTFYAEGSVVEYEGHRYKIIQPHTSQGDWNPSITPALWGRMDDHDGGGEYHQQQHHHQGQQQHHDSEKHQNYVPPTQGGLPSGDGVTVHHEERQKHWYDLDDKRKQELEIGGGLLAGAALLAGGYAAFKHHEKSEEEKKAQTWSLQNWVHDAEARTAQYRQYGPSGPATWILNQGKNIPQEAIVVGQEKSWTLYICRAFYDGGIQVGKASDAFQKGGVIGYKHEEIHVGTYEILVGDMNGLRWVDTSGHLNVDSLGYRPVEGGREPDGTPLYVASAYHHDAVHPGKASRNLEGAYIPYDGGEKCVKSYRVLCYNG
ncbi:Carbohydrate-binding module family 12 protein [Mycena venus]|uniref:Carbohydrate-binding module family 12 protein n=1 Tax=Mycena venus TaxID=2733690 RepID=A0A8H6YN57_9AGAR|nr:Carbohydrate-binding module family 12 protein [Mycena venus]